MASKRFTNSGFPNKEYCISCNIYALQRLEALKPNSRIMIVLCGLPGCGKSTFASRLMDSFTDEYRQRWVLLNQDKLGSRQKVISQATHALNSKKCVIIDRCNFDAEQRAPYVQLSSQFKVDALVCLVLPNHTNEELCATRAIVRGNSDGIHGEDVNWTMVCRTMRNDFVFPVMGEGYSAIYSCFEENDMIYFANRLCDIALQ